MKKSCFLVLICCLTFFSCKKKLVDEGPGELYGKWRLTESYADPGDGSGRYKKVSGNAKFLVVDRSGQLSGEALSDLSSFKILDSVSVEVYSNTYKRSLVYRYKVSASMLTLNPPCIEGCGFRFVRE